MKKLVFVAVMLLSVSLVAQDNADFKKETIEFIKLSGSSKAFEDAISQIGMNVPADKKDAYTKEANETLGDLYSQLADIYMKEFTQEEIKTLVEFYNTDLGKKLASKQALMAQKGMMIGQTRGMQVGQIAQKYSN